MDDNKLLLELPKDLLFIITSYNHLILFNLPKNTYMKFDWFALIKRDFSLTYAKESTTNHNMMKTYIWNCIKDKLNSQISMSPYHVIVTVRKNKLMSCGSNNKCQLGRTYSEKENFFTPIKLPKKISISQIICGILHTTVKLDNGNLMNVGTDYYEPIHKDILTDNLFREIKNITEDPKNISQVVCGYNNTLVLLTDGTLMACGYNIPGCRTRGHITDLTKISYIPKPIVEIACSENHIIIRLVDGTLMGAGSNYYGELGLGPSLTNYETNYEFHEIKNIPKNIVQIACGSYHTIIRLTDGTLLGCGDNTSGQLGFYKNQIFKKFIKLDNLPKNIVEVSCGGLHSMIRLTDGSLMSCGSNSNGELGHGDFMRRDTFTTIQNIPKNIIQVICKGHNTLIRLADNTIMNCGNNQYGQLGDGSYKNKSRFRKVGFYEKDKRGTLYAIGKEIKIK
ncbi:MAG: chromosome condensation regulator [Edafosvirus sp.]|uniref:Chromosome condensation regulator n=1 Tax=Edafosvirus sp. TaxID=2487765 RepID=A0A3G4ZWU7_9VIRU|nr:MAG: chromosome condensation regulator [Edafosvirus sp.]